MGKRNGKQPAESRSKAGKPRKYGQADGEICRPLSVSAPAVLIDRLDVRARQIGIGRSDLVVAAIRAALAQSADRLASEVADSGQEGQS